MWKPPPRFLVVGRWAGKCRPRWCDPEQQVLHLEPGLPCCFRTRREGCVRHRARVWHAHKRFCLNEETSQDDPAQDCCEDYGQESPGRQKTRPRRWLSLSPVIAVFRCPATAGHQGAGQDRAGRLPVAAPRCGLCLVPAEVFRVGSSPEAVLLYLVFTCSNC